MPPRTSSRKRNISTTVKAEEKAPVEKSTGAAKKPSAPKKKAAPTSKTPSKKRKAAAVEGSDEDEKEHECDSHDEGAEEAEVKPTPKKRKTKEDKEAEMAPLAVRTAISSLPKAMYIGAHVSGAGGKQYLHALVHTHQLIHLPRRPKLHHQRRTYWRQRPCALSQIPTKMDLPTPRSHSARCLPRSRQDSRLRIQPPRPSARLIPRQPRASRRRQSRPGLRQLHRRPAPLRRPRHRPLQLSPRQHRRRTHGGGHGADCRAA